MRFDLIQIVSRFRVQGLRFAYKMTSTTDVLMSFLGDLDSEPEFFFPDHVVDNDMNLNNFGIAEDTFKSYFLLYVSIYP